MYSLGGGWALSVVCVYSQKLCTRFSTQYLIISKTAYWYFSCLTNLKISWKCTHNMVITIKKITIECNVNFLISYNKLKNVCFQGIYNVCSC